MKDQQFEQFATEVLKRGALAVLPQHLPDHWLKALLEEADILQEGDCHEREDTCAGLLGAVILLLSAQSGHPPEMEVAASTLLRSLEYYISRSLQKWSVDKRISGSNPRRSRTFFTKIVR